MAHYAVLKNEPDSIKTRAYGVEIRNVWKNDLEHADRLHSNADLLTAISAATATVPSLIDYNHCKPPIIFGDVSRSQPMTVKWSSCKDGGSSKNNSFTISIRRM